MVRKEHQNPGLTLLPQSTSVAPRKSVERNMFYRPNEMLFSRVSRLRVAVLGSDQKSAQRFFLPASSNGVRKVYVASAVTLSLP